MSVYSRLLPIGLVLSVAAPAFAAATSVDGDALKPAFRNTIVSTYPDGRQARLWLNADGTYTAAGRKGDPSGGRWMQKDGKLCLKQSKPFAAPISYCTAMIAGGVGTEWRGKAVTGEAIKIKLVKGGR